MEDSKRKNAIERFYLKCGFATRALHAGEDISQDTRIHSHTNAIYQTSTFKFENAEEGAKLFEHKKHGYIYTRLGNPTVMVLEAKMNALEGRNAKLEQPDKVRISSLVFPSGMSAISSTMLALLESGDKLISGEVLYGCTEDLFAKMLPKFNIETTFVDTSDLNAFEKAMRENPNAKLVYFETPTNPTMAITDIRKVTEIARSINKNIHIIVDNTFATPFLQRPLELGADIVLHSTTKYICGHGTVVGGVVVTSCDDVKDALYKVMVDIGPSPSPFDAWLVNMGLKTLPVRMQRHCQNAMEVATFLENHPAVATVAYPGLKNFKFHQLAKEQMDDFGGIISFELKGGYQAGKNLMDNVHIFTLAVSLGCVDSLIQHPASMTHATVPKEVRQRVGITDGLVRISVGLEDADDLIRDLDQALKKNS
ncbi:PLP-dependent transferase [candidate division KSB1 bacterium]|nr:PLP-dependent transferase [candidate division KSB1 bacterium]